jgi:hypothetical protein
VTPARLAVPKVAGRASVCPLPIAVEADANRHEQIRREKEIAGASRAIAKEPAGYRPIDRQLMHWRVPAGGERLLAVLLAEQEREVFGAAEQAPRPGDMALDDGGRLGVRTRAAIGLGRPYAPRVGLGAPYAPVRNMAMASISTSSSGRHRIA